MFVQAIATEGTAPHTTLTSGNINTTQGNLLVLGINTSDNGSTVTVTDNKGNTWVPYTANPEPISGAGVKVLLFYAKNIQGGTGHNFTVNMSVSSTFAFVTAEFSGEAIDFPIAGQTSSHDSVAQNFHSLGVLNTPQDGCDVVAFNATSTVNVETFTPGGGWTIPPNGQVTDGTISQACFIQYRQGVAQSVNTNTWTSSDVVQGGSIVFAIKQPSYTFIQQGSKSTGVTAVNTLSVSAPMTITSGNTLIYCAYYTLGSKSPVSMSDSAGLIPQFVQGSNNPQQWTEAYNVFNPTLGYGFVMGYANNITGGTTTFTAQFGSNLVTFAGVLVLEFAGIADIAPFTTGEAVSNQQAGPGTGTDAIVSGLLPFLNRQPSMLFGLSMDISTVNSAPAIGSGFNSAGTAWFFQGASPVASAMHRRLTSTNPTQVTATAQAALGADTYFTAAMVLSEVNGSLSTTQIVSSGIFVTP